MIKHFYYTKADGSVSERLVHPIGVVDDKLFAVDLSEFPQDEIKEYEEILTSIHKQYIEAIKDVGLGNSFRYFFFDGIEDVQK